METHFSIILYEGVIRTRNKSEDKDQFIKSQKDNINNNIISIIYLQMCFVYMPSCFGLPWNILIKTEIFSKIFSCAFNVTTCGIVWNVFHQKTEHFPSSIFLVFEGSEK